MGIPPWNSSAGEVEHLAEPRSAAAADVLARRVDVLDREDQALHGPGLTRGESLAERNRTCRLRRRQLDGPKGVADDDVSIAPPTQALVEALGAIDIGDG